MFQKLRNGAEAHILSLGYLCYALLFCKRIRNVQLSFNEEKIARSKTYNLFWKAVLKFMYSSNATVAKQKV